MEAGGKNDLSQRFQGFWNVAASSVKSASQSPAVIPSSYLSGSWCPYDDSLSCLFTHIHPHIKNTHSHRCSNMAVIVYIARLRGISQRHHCHCSSCLLQQRFPQRRRNSQEVLALFSGLCSSTFTSGGAHKWALCSSPTGLLNLSSEVWCFTALEHVNASVLSEGRQVDILY